MKPDCCEKPDIRQVSLGERACVKCGTVYDCEPCEDDEKKTTSYLALELMIKRQNGNGVLIHKTKDFLKYYETKINDGISHLEYMAAHLPITPTDFIDVVNLYKKIISLPKEAPEPLVDACLYIISRKNKMNITLDDILENSITQHKKIKSVIRKIWKTYGIKVQSNDFETVFLSYAVS